MSSFRWLRQKPAQETAAGFFMHTSKEELFMKRKMKIVAEGP